MTAVDGPPLSAAAVVDADGWAVLVAVGAFVVDLG